MLLNNTVGLTIGFREYSNNTLNLWGDSGIYTLKTTASYVPNLDPTPTPAPLATLQPTPTLVPVSKPHSTPCATTSPTPTSAPIPDEKAAVFSYETIPIVISTVIVVFFAVIFLVFKKGYVTIHIVDEQTPEPSNDY